jgi:hypothetical protein
MHAKLETVRGPCVYVGQESRQDANKPSDVQGTLRAPMDAEPQNPESHQAGSQGQAEGRGHSQGI